MKKKAAIFFILLANIAFLAYTVVPHHHHESQLCIENAHCEEDENAHSSNSFEHNHEHDAESNSEYCVLKQVVIIPEQTKHECKRLNNNNSHHSFFSKYQPALSYGKGNVFSSTLKINRYCVFISSFFTRFLNLSKALRAPPLV